MIEIKNKKECCGCTACVQICPRSCIELTEDKEGFLYPVVNKEKCINCNLCEKVCPYINHMVDRSPQKVFAAKNINEHNRYRSSSGGIFILFAEQTIKEGGVVFGAKFDENWNVVHDHTEKKENLIFFIGSKYVQSRIGNSYKKVKSYLDSGRKVLFSGTPCQVAGLQLYLKKKYDNLLTIDFICHGVPSPLIWHKYLFEVKSSFCKKDANSIKINKIFFRDKSEGWKHFALSINISSFEKKKEFSFLEIHHNNPFIKGFLKNLYLRMSCHACPSKSGKSNSDITIADFWGIEKVIPSFYDEKGVSLCIIYDLSTFSLFKNLPIEMKMVHTSIIEQYNKSFYYSSPLTDSRDLFYTFFFKYGVIKSVNKILEEGIFTRIYRHTIRRIYHFTKKSI